MAVKRLTIELDDIPDVSDPTTSPSSLLPQETLPARQGGTELPSRQADYQDVDAGPSPETGKPANAFGRTLADLVFAFVNRPEFMATFFVFIAFTVSVARFQKISDLWITVIFALALNVTWFGIIGIRKLCSRKVK